jgi:hypothetical protein
VVVALRSIASHDEASMSTTVLTSQRTDPTDGSRLDKVLEVAEGAIAEQFQISERLDSKARGQLTIAGAWFAVVQTVARSAFDIRGLDDRWITWIIITAAAGGAALIATMVLSSRVWRLRTESGIAPNGLIQMANDARRGAADEKLLLHYVDTLDRRFRNNDTRAKWMKWAQRVWYLAMLFPLAELAIAFAAQARG